MVNQYEIYWVELDPTRGSELRKTRPCIVISPDEMNHNINTVIIAPLTSTSKTYPTRVQVEFEGREGWIVLDQIRCTDKSRLLRKAGELSPDKITEIKTVLKKMLVD
jgi:mRNA interferase MazF